MQTNTPDPHLKTKLAPIILDTPRDVIDFEFTEDDIHILISRIVEDSRTKDLTAEIIIEHPPGHSFLSPAKISLSSSADRVRLFTLLTRAYYTDKFIPWDNIIETVCQESIERFRNGQYEKHGYHIESTTLSDVEAQTINWLWEPYIPFGKLTLLEGDPGVGKSWLSLAIMTAISLGHGFPGQTALAHGPCLLASAEDGLADTIKPRLTDMGANTKIIHALPDLFTFDESGFDALEIKIAELLPVLIIVDPLVAYLPGTMDINKANQARYATARLAALADKWGPAIIAIRHLTKGGSLKPIYRGLGSIDFTAAARSVLLAGQDPDNKQVRGFAHLKSNLAVAGEPIGYELREGKFYWKEHSDLTAEVILQSGNDAGNSSIDDASAFIVDMLNAGPVPAKEILSEASNHDISTPTLNRAKKALGVISYRDGEKGREGGGKWVWNMPEKGS